MDRLDVRIGISDERVVLPMVDPGAALEVAEPEAQGAEPAQD